MKIVVLDGYTTTRNDLNLDGLKQLGELQVYDITKKSQLIERAKDFDILVTNKTEIFRSDLDNLPNCKFISILATGYDTVDIQAAAEKGIPVSIVPTYGTPSVAQLVFALLLELCQQVGHHSEAVKSGKWSEQKYNTFSDCSIIELLDKTIGFVGFGRIGQYAAKIAQAFGMHIIAYDKFKPEVKGLVDFKWVEMDELLEKSDVVSLHCPLFPDTLGLIDRGALQKMKKSAFLINTSRGRLVVTEDLAEALNNGWIAGAGLDVLWDEPPEKDNLLLKAKNCIITPHYGWASRESRSRLIQLTIDNVKAYLCGKPVNTVNM